MRCLHCDRQLGLIKSLKGETFCSPEHEEQHRRDLAAETIKRIRGRNVSPPSEAGAVPNPVPAARDHEFILAGSPDLEPLPADASPLRPRVHSAVDDLGALSAAVQPKSAARPRKKRKGRKSAATP